MLRAKPITENHSELVHRRRKAVRGAVRTKTRNRRDYTTAPLVPWCCPGAYPFVPCPECVKKGPPQSPPKGGHWRFEAPFYPALNGIACRN